VCGTQQCPQQAAAPSTSISTLNKYQHPQQIAVLQYTLPQQAAASHRKGSGLQKHRRTEAASSGDNGTRSQEGPHQDHRSAIKTEAARVSPTEAARVSPSYDNSTMYECVLVGVGEGPLYSR